MWYVPDPVLNTLHVLSHYLVRKILICVIMFL